MKIKKSAIYVLFGLLILLSVSGCGGGGKKGGGAAKANIQGLIVDQNGEGVPGVSVRLGNNAAITDSTGAFEFIGVGTGQAQITGSGGSERHYIIETTTIMVAAGDNVLDPIRAYRMIGCGVVIQSVSYSYGAGLKLAYSDPYSLDPGERLRFSADDLVYAPLAGEELSFSPGIRMSLFNMAGDFILDNDTFFLLNWEPIAGAENYEILFIVRDGIPVNVWRSRNDAGFDRDDPTAYLNIADELRDCGITGPGEYAFRIVPLDSSGQKMRQLPDMTISLGLMLTDYPRNLRLEEGQTLTWSTVPGADGYRVSIYNSDDELVYRRGDRELITGNTLELPDNLTSGEYYMWFVDAHALDDTEWSAEISRGISGFIY